ncbi:SDR family NAD(P)-dependent oxidoreductase [Nocardioides sp. TRM66260-LWL]|uniref:oxidoreductase n=1 Tax=Nocardioides sp. TRM66260-LWL TaxID=2874478 RepID=UPI001CC7DA0D|nr:oxidoreductase [Nocardioides sp. TRM66260-LWL]MBZ5735410.1 SDR family NAD(P)-dependent oxidoreductase [Nocardioides sp. TRM66260-LWL]
MTWTDVPDLTGRTALVTGANAGLGLETTIALAGAGAQVLMACRNRGKADAAADAVRRRHPAADVRVVDLDLADLASVERLAALLLDEDRPLDLLINNAGLMAVDEARTAQGLELQYGVNHLGHHALTGRLVPLLLRSDLARVVSVSSMGHRAARGRPDPTLERRYDRWNAYFHSKLDNLYFTAELQRRAAAAGSHLTALAAHPGGSDTDLGVEGSGVSNRAIGLLAPLLAQPAADGARPTLRAATDRTLPGGAFVGPRFVVRGRTPVVERPSRRARDADAARRLWEESVAQSGVDPEVALRG